VVHRRKEMKAKQYTATAQQVFRIFGPGDLYATASDIDEALPSKIVGLLKGYSSRIVRREFPALAKRTGRDQLWTSAYYVGTAGQVSAETIRRYITQCQGQ